jgi:hypothetical protein
MTDTHPFGPEQGDMARAFRLPSFIAENPELADLFDVTVTRLRSEASGLPMNTVQLMLMERIATFYVTIKYREDANEWSGVNQQKEFNAYWLSLTTEFNNILQKNDDSLRQAMLLEIQSVVMDAIKAIDDPEQRRKVRLSVAEGLAAIGQ